MCFCVKFVCVCVSLSVCECVQVRCLGSVICVNVVSVMFVCECVRVYKCESICVCVCVCVCVREFMRVGTSLVWE